VADEPERMYGWKEAAALVGVSVRQLQEWIKDGRFPEPNKSGKTVRWMASEIRAWQYKFIRGEVPPAPEKAKKKPT
jgi:excisionase family DNA binding protein